MKQFLSSYKVYPFKHTISKFENFRVKINHTFQRANFIATHTRNGRFNIIHFFPLFLFFSQESLKHHARHRARLPTKFWVAVAFLVVGFHLYLAKIIYSECFKEKENVRSKIYMSWLLLDVLLLQDICCAFGIVQLTSGQGKHNWYEVIQEH